MTGHRPCRGRRVGADAGAGAGVVAGRACGRVGRAPVRRRRVRAERCQPAAHRLRAGGRRQPRRGAGGHAEALVRRGIRPDLVFGASVGAINGAAYAGRPDARGHRPDGGRLARGEGDRHLPPRHVRRPLGLLPEATRRARQHGAARIIEAGIDYENLEEADDPDRGGDDLAHRRARALDRPRPRGRGHPRFVGHPVDLPAVTIDGDVLVDGGVVNNVPISRAIAAGCDRIYVLLCGPLHYHPPPPRRPAEAALTAFFVAVHARFVRELATLPPGVEVVVFSGGGEPAGQYRDFSATATLIEEGRAEVADVLDRYAGTSHDLGAAPPAPPPPAPPPPAPPAAAPPAPPEPAGADPARGAGRARADALGPDVSTDGYLLSNDAPEAMDRFTAFAALFDPSTFRHLDGSGLAPGWRCWEVGAGGTSVRAPSGRAGRARRARPGHRHRRVVGRRGRWPQRRGPPARRGVDPPPRGSLRPGPRPPRPRARARARRRPGHHGRRPPPGRRAAGRGRRPGAPAPAAAWRRRAPSRSWPTALRRGFRTLLAERGVDLAYGRIAAPPPPRRRPGRRGRRRRLPGHRPRLQRTSRWPPSPSIRDQLLEHGIATEEEIERHLASVRAGRLDLAQPPMISCWGRRPPPA